MGRDKPFRNKKSTSATSIPGTHTHAESDVTSLTADLALKAPLASPTFTGTVGGITKTMVGLSNVANVDQQNGSNITSGTVALARIGTGTPAAGKYVDGGTGAWTTLPGGGGTGDVVGPASAVGDNLASYNLTTGKIIKDSGLAASAVATLTGSQVLASKDLTATSNSFTAASTTQVGVSRLSTNAETTALTLATVGVTPASLNACLASLNYRDATALTGNVPITHGGTGVATLPTGLLVGAGTSAITAVTAPAGAVVGTSDTQALTGKDLTGVGNTFPTFNQNTTGSAATLTTSRTIGTLTGDVTSAGSGFNGSAANTNATTLATVNSNVGSFGSASSVATFTVNAKGLTTAAASTPIAIAGSAITSGTVAVANGGTGSATAAAAITALTGTQTSGQYLRSNGTSAALAAIVAGDVPTLNQNTTGSAAKWTTARTVAITGDLTYNSGSLDGTANVTAAGTLATVNGSPGTTGTADTVAQVTVNGKGLVTSTASRTIAIAGSQITSGQVPVAQLATGTPAAGKYPDGGGAWTVLPVARPFGLKFNLIATSGGFTDPGTGSLRFFTGGGSIFVNYTDADAVDRSSFLANCSVFNGATVHLTNAAGVMQVCSTTNPTDNGTYLEIPTATTLTTTAFTSGQPIYLVMTPNN